MKESIEHPCLSCPLPDCDDNNPRCNLRQAMNTYRKALRRKQVTPTVRARNSIAYQELYGLGRYESRKASRGTA